MMKAWGYLGGGGGDPGKNSTRILGMEKGAVLPTSGREGGSAPGKPEGKAEGRWTSYLKAATQAGQGGGGREGGGGGGRKAS